MSFRPVCFAAALLLAASAGTARADMIDFFGTGGSASNPVSFSGTMTVTTNQPGTAATITVALKNTTSSGQAVNYGYITGFGLNVPNLTITGATGTSTDADFRFLKASTDTTSLQGGEFDYAFSTDSTSPYQLHTVPTGDIAKGLGAGAGATFTINLTGTGLGGLNAQQVIKELSASPAVPFAVRFRSTNTSKYKGLAPPDGDKVPYTGYTIPPVEPPPSNGVVPAPPGVVLAGIGVVCLFGRVRRKNVAPTA